MAELEQEHIEQLPIAELTAEIVGAYVGHHMVRCHRPAGPDHYRRSAARRTCPESCRVARGKTGARRVN